MKKTKAVIDDGFQPELVEGAEFEGIFEIPALKKINLPVLPEGITPFSRRQEAPTDNEALGFFEPDVNFADLLRNPVKYADSLRKFAAVITPDCSLYRDAPFAVQLCNIYRRQAMGHFWQRQGLNVLALVRWGSPDTYTTKRFPEAAAFAGIPHRAPIVISTYGCIKSQDDRYHFEAGLAECLETLEPSVVLVHGAMSREVFAPYEDHVEFRHYNDWITRRKGGKNG